MCFIKENNELLTAKKDIICYKYIYKNLVSSVREFQYELNKKYYIRFWRLKNLFYVFNNYDEINDKFIFIGFHSYHLTNHMPKVNYECIIPKGSKYYKNCEQYVSNSIIIKKKIDGAGF
jgi:hypothetical protein